MIDALKITDVISYASGWALLKQKQDAFADISATLEAMTERNLRRLAVSTRRPEGEISISSYPNYFNHALRLRGWVEHRIRPAIPGGLNVLMPNLKNGVSARFQVSSDTSPKSFSNWVLLDVPRSVNVCDVCVLCVLADSSSALIDAHVWKRTVPTFERCSAQLADLIPLRSPVPFVVLGVSRSDRPLSIAERAADLDYDSEFDQGIEKSIEFPHEYYQAGVSILSYFGEVLRQKHPHIRAKVRIEQDGLTVRMHIESPSGDKEVIEKTLEEYGLVIAEQIPPEALFESRLQVVALEQKLELAKAEIRYNRQLLALAEGAYQQRLSGLQEEVDHLRTYIGRHLSQTDSLHVLLARQSETNERLLVAHVSQTESLLQNLIRQSVDNQAVVEALTTIDQKLTQGIEAADEEEIKRALAVIHREKPTMFTHLQSILLNLSYEVSGGFLFKWIEALTRQV